MYEEKYQKSAKHAQELDKEKYSLQIQVKEKANEVKSTIDR